tara:strand:+ start:1841 stop:2425 length:585 start_codon:yes stop_codon:yes gene_type:complete
MAILRAGPDVQGRPVSCANDTSSSAWPWQYIKKVYVGIVTHTGCESTPGGDSPVTTSTDSNDSNVETATGDFSISSSGTSNHGTTIEIGFEFSYQATQSFQIKITYNGLASVSSGQGIFPSSNIRFSDSETGGLGFNGFPSLSGSVTRTLPASVVPAVYSATLKVAVGIEFPYDICTPNPGSANASATLEIEFL